MITINMLLCAQMTVIRYRRCAVIPRQVWGENHLVTLVAGVFEKHFCSRTFKFKIWNSNGYIWSAVKAPCASVRHPWIRCSLRAASSRLDIMPGYPNLEFRSRVTIRNLRIKRRLPSWWILGILIFPVKRCFDDCFLVKCAFEFGRFPWRFQRSRAV